MHVVVRLVHVTMINFGFVVGVWNEVCRDELVYSRGFQFAIVTQTDGKVPVGVRRSRQHLRFLVLQRCYITIATNNVLLIISAHERKAYRIVLFFTVAIGVKVGTSHFQEGLSLYKLSGLYTPTRAVLGHRHTVAQKHDTRGRTRQD